MLALEPLDFHEDAVLFGDNASDEYEWGHKETVYENATKNNNRYRMTPKDKKIILVE